MTHPFILWTLTVINLSLVVFGLVVGYYKSRWLKRYEGVILLSWIIFAFLPGSFHGFFMISVGGTITWWIFWSRGFKARVGYTIYVIFNIITLAELIQPGILTKLAS
jgi:hypothetical protein